MTNPLIIIQARHGGTRLPGKIDMDLCGERMIDHVVKRVNRVTTNWVIAMAEDYPTIDVDDVLSRFVKVAEFFPACDPLVRVTADCPLWDSGLGFGIIDRYAQSGAPFVGTSPAFDGLDVEVFSRWALYHADRRATHAYDREHVTRLMRQLPGAVEVPLYGPALRWSVDDLDGLRFVERVFTACAHCRGGVPHHTNAATSIGGEDRRPIWDLHWLHRGDLVECTAHDILMERTGGLPYMAQDPRSPVPKVP